MIKKALSIGSLLLIGMLILSACGSLRNTADKNKELNQTLPY